MQDLFVEYLKSCVTVICCRFSPSQKAEVVRMIKEGKTHKRRTVTMAVGDGANDVNMIQTAHVGVGIYGNEGMHAVQASDFAVGDFQLLERLVFWHGRLDYMRIGNYVLLFWYKQLACGISLIFYTFACGYSAQTPYPSIYLSLYSIIYTSMPVNFKGAIEQDINDKTDGEHFKRYYPDLYFYGSHDVSQS